MAISFTPQDFAAATGNPARQLQMVNELIAYGGWSQEYSDGSNTNRMANMSDLINLREKLKQEVAFANGQYGASVAVVFSGVRCD
jgi:hypothetical protein